MDRFHRQLGIFDPTKAEDRKITVIGSGSVGSFTVLTLCKLGFKNISVYDFDKIEEANLPNQFFRNDDIDKYKVDALCDIVSNFSDSKIKAIKDPYVDQKIEDIAIVAVDSMDTRLEIWEHIKYNMALKLFIDARMGGEQMRIYTLNPVDMTDIGAYEKNLYPSDEADELPCTERSIIYNVLSIASFISAYVKKHCNGENPPFETIFDIKTMGMIINEYSKVFA